MLKNKNKVLTAWESLGDTPATLWHNDNILEKIYVRKYTKVIY